MTTTEIIREVMNKKSKPAAEIADKLNKSQSLVLNRISQTNISIDKLQEILSVLGYTIAIVPDTYSFTDNDAYIVTSSKNISPVIAEEISVVSQEPTAPTKRKIKLSTLMNQTEQK